MSLLNKRVDPKLAKQIEDDIADIDGVPSLKVTNETPKRNSGSEVCDCTGGPGKDNQPGTGLLDDTTICPRCLGTGIVAK